jgi:hypothetical protein
MKRFALPLTLLAVLATPLIAHALIFLQAALSTTVSAGVATGTAPTAATFTVTNGSTIGNSIDLTQVDGFRVEVCAASGQTLSGAGAERAYLLNHNGEVLRNPGLDLSISVTATGSASCFGAACRCQVFPDQHVSASAASGLVMYVPDAVSVSGGTTLTTRISGHKDSRL